MKVREDQARQRYDAAKGMSPDVSAAADEYIGALGRRMTMEAQLASQQAKRKLLDRVQGVIGNARRQLESFEPPPPPSPAAASVAAAIDESRLLQAVVDTQEEERRRVARQVHDGPAQAMANVVLQSEISERLYEVDPKRSREELAGLRAMVNKTLQELRGFIFELRPMILDDLGLVPTLRRYIQTLVDKHQVRVDLASTGRDRRLHGDEEVAIFRLIQDSLVERIERGGAKIIALSMNWLEDALEITLQSDGRELPRDAELSSGLRRSERLALLRGTEQQETRTDGTSVLRVRVPVKGGSQLIT
ncbi:MAG TPA: histidine kinase [Candidatus Limnocylindria bacterium]|nr:histidine kinase [Candidatus Limnocylindria bacterium]